MSRVNRLLRGFNELVLGLNELSHRSAGSFYEPISAYDEHTLVSEDGSLCTALDFRGALCSVGAQEFERIVGALTDGLAPFMEHSGHLVQMTLHYDPDDAPRLIEGALASTRVSAQTLGLSLEPMLDDTAETLARYCATERVRLVLWTLPEVLVSAERQSARIEMGKRLERSAEVVDAMPPERYLASLVEPHRSFVAALRSALEQAEVDHGLLDAHTLVWEQRQQMFPELTGEHWQAVLPGDRLMPRAPGGRSRHGGEKNIGYLLAPRLRSQLFVDEVEDLSATTVRFGEQVHAPLMMSVGPSNLKPFNVLFRSLLTKRFPWRASFVLDGAGLSSYTLRSSLASILFFSNKRLVGAIDELKARFDNNEAVVRFRATFDTWGVDEAQARSRRSDLAGAVQAWGGCDVSPISGDPTLLSLSSQPAVMRASPAPKMAAPLSHSEDNVARLLPLGRPSAPWKEGSLLLRTPDGKLFPYQVMSSLQAAWVDIGVAPMGGGKSVLLNAINLAFALQPGLESLPWISVVDIGPSSSGLISLLRSALPERERHLVAYHRLRMTPEYAINPFDLPLGCHVPLPLHQSFLVNFLALLCTEDNADEAQDGIRGIARACIEMAYDEFSPRRNPKRYVRGVDETIDGWVESADWGAEIHSWWDLVERLFAEGRHHDALYAQRYAVPLLADVASMARRDAISGLYTAKTAGGEPITSFFWRACVDAIAAYPILKQATAFDIGDARIVSLDLDEVAPKVGRQAGIMYMLARHVIGSRFFLMPKDVELMPEAVRAYHGKRIRAIREAPKRLCYDEFHRVSKNNAMATQIVSDIETAVRESRKWNLSVGLYSQDIDDYPEVLVELASAFFVLGAGTEQGARKIQERFGLNQTTTYALTRLGKPGPQGSRMVAVFKTGKGVVQQVLTTTLGRQSLWAFSSTAEDVAVRNALYEVIGVAETLALLADRFPGGVKSELEARKAARGLADEADERESQNLVDALVQELLALRQEKKT